MTFAVRFCRFPICLFFTICNCALGPQAPANASITLANPLNGSTTSDFTGVGLIGDSEGFFASGVVIADGRYVLTARHAVTDDSTINGKLRSPSDIAFSLENVSHTITGVWAAFSADIALLQLDLPVPVSYPLWSIELGNELGRTFSAVGYGATDSDGNGAWGPGGFGTRRLFQNRVDQIVTGTISGQGEVLKYDFDPPGGDAVGSMEGIAGPGDSGGPALLDWQGQWYVAGIISSTSAPIYGGTGSILQVSHYRGPIEAIIPEPGLLTVAAAAMVIPCRRKRTVLYSRRSILF